MTSPTARLLEEALRLPEKDRGELVAGIMESLGPEAEDDAELTWASEIQTRIEDFEKQRVKPIPWAEARRQILENDDGGAIS